MVAINSVLRAVNILNQFRPHDNATLSLGEVAKLTGLNKATAHGLISNLVREKFLQQDPVTRRYSLGPALFELGSLYRSRIGAYSASLPAMRELSEKLGKTVQLAMLMERDIIYISRIMTREFMSFSVAEGVRVYAHCTSTGKSMLARLDEAELDALYAEESLPARTAYSIRTRRELKEHLRLIRDRGYAIDYQEVDVGLCGVAMAFRADQLMAVGISCTVDVVDKGEVETYLPLLRQTCQSISNLLGGTL